MDEQGPAEAATETGECTTPTKLQAALDAVDGALMLLGDEMEDEGALVHPVRDAMAELGYAQAYIEQTTGELERVRAGFDAMAAEHAAASACPRDEEFNTKDAVAFGCQVDAEGELDTYDCQHSSAECWQRVFIERGTRQ